MMLVMGMMFRMGIGRLGGSVQLGIYLRRHPAQRRAHFINVTSRPLGPGQTGRGEEQHARQQHPAQAYVQTTAVLHPIVNPSFGPGKPPQRNTAEGSNPHPRRCQLAIESPGIAKQQGPVQIIDSLAQRQNTAGAIDGHIAFDRQGHGIDKDSPVLRNAKLRIGKHYPRRLSIDKPRADGMQTQCSAGYPLGHRYLFGQRLMLPG